EGRAAVPGHVPCDDAAVHDAIGERDTDRGRADLLPSAEPGANCRALVDVRGASILVGQYHERQRASLDEEPNDGFPLATARGTDSERMIMAKQKAISIWDPKITRRALLDAIRKLNPIKMMGNPVMFVVEVGSVLTTILLIRNIAQGAGVGFELQITLWLWFTVLFANFAEAMAEGRGKAQADTLRKAKTETVAHRLLPDGGTEDVPAAGLARG